MKYFMGVAAHRGRICVDVDAFLRGPFLVTLMGFATHGGGGWKGEIPKSILLRSVLGDTGANWKLNCERLGRALDLGRGG